MTESRTETTDEDIRELFDDSNEDSQTFDGFTIRDLRSFLSIDRQTPLYISTPSLPQATRRNSFTESDQDVDGECYNVSKFRDITSSKIPQALSAEPSNAEDSEEVSEIEGEMETKVFTARKLAEEEKDISEPDIFLQSSDSEMEGEIFLSCLGTIESSEAVKETVQSKLEIQDGSQSVIHTAARVRRSRVLPCKDIVGLSCSCKSRCLDKITLSQTKKARERFREENPTFEKQRKYILDWFDDNQPTDRTFVYSICGVFVCWKAWVLVLGITKRRFYMLKRDYLHGRRNPSHGLTGVMKESIQGEACRNFLEKYFSECCDYLPNASIWHLTSSSTKSDVYEEMKSHVLSIGQPCCSSALFRKIWTNDYPHVKIPKENRFSKCDVCCKLKEELRNTRNPIQKAAIHDRRKGHVKFVREERKSYMARGSLAHFEPQKYFSMAIDGMDTTKTELPFSKVRYGTVVKAWHLRVHCLGVLLHGRHPMCMLDFHEYPHDSNLTLNTLLQVMWVHRAFLPNIVFLQMDNTAKENKNQYVFSFLAYLVETKVFDRIEVSFLPVGHTHIDVDQMFSRLSVGLERAGCLTYRDFLGILRQCYTQSQGQVTQEGARPQYARTPHQYAIREWLLPHMFAVHGLNSFHHFAFVRNEQEKAELHFKPWCTGQWDTCQYEPLILLKSMPRDVPELVKPDYRAIDLGKLRGMVNKCTEVGVFTGEDKEEWEGFLEKEEKLAESYDDVDEIEYIDKTTEGFKYHKKCLVYMKANGEEWIVDELRERKRIDICLHRDLQLDEVLRKSEATERGEGLLPVYTGPYRRPGQIQRDILRNQNSNDIKSGMLVALKSDFHQDRPLIARVNQVKDNALSVTWQYGRWTTSWDVLKKREGRLYTEWKEEVSKDDVLLFDFELTSSGKLRSATVTELKRVYGIP